MLNDGWWEQPADRTQPWTAHRFRFGARGGAHILVDDVNGDGRNDIITALDAHRWGLSWFENMKADDGGITFREHRIMGDRKEEPRFGVAFSQPHALALADLDGDGDYDFVLKSEVNPQDNSRPGVTGETLLQGYKPDGTLLWTIKLGRNIREGAHYTQFMVYDLDGDGRAEVAVRPRTAPSTAGAR